MKDLKQFAEMTGIDRIAIQIDEAQKYNVDHRATKGRHWLEVNHLHPKKLTLKVVEIRKETESAKTIRLASPDGYIPPFVAGQYLTVDAEINGISTTRAYTISSSSTQRAWYEITVRENRNGFVSDFLLNSLKVGDTITTSGPSGEFYRMPSVHGKRLVFISGGSGITPFMSMLQTDYEKLVTDYDIDLIYGCAHEDDIIFRERLEDLAAKGVFRLHPVISEPSEDCKYFKGFITKELIKEISGDVSSCTYFLCGPSAMYNFVIPQIESMDVKGRQIRREVQTMPADPTKLPGWPEEISENNVYTIKLPDGRTIDAKATETIITALEKAGIVIPTLCRSGECSACRTKLISGNVFHPGNELLRKADMRFGYIHPCVTYPISNIEILL